MLNQLHREIKLSLVSIGMDSKLIKEQIDQFVEWTKPKPIKDAVNLKERKAIKRHLQSLGHDEEDIEDVLNQMEEDSRMVVDGVNITVFPEIKSIKPVIRLCELDCGSMTENQVLSYSWVQETKTWATHCSQCNLVYAPDGKSFKNYTHARSYIANKMQAQDK